MKPTDRLEDLQILMPGTPDVILHYLAADQAIEPWENSHEERELFVAPVADFFHRFKIDKTKLQRIVNHCGESGAIWLRNRFFYWNRERVTREAGEYGLAAQAARYIGANHEALAETLNSVVSQGGQIEPLVEFDTGRAVRVLKCDDVLRYAGRYNGKSIEACHKMLRELVRKLETDTRQRSPQEILGLVPPRKNYPNCVFSDGKFGDGQRLIIERDESGRVIRQFKESKYPPLVPGLQGLSRDESIRKINAVTRERKEQKRRAEGEK